MYLLSSKTEIRAALATMNAHARASCMRFATHLLTDPTIADDADRLGEYCAGSIAVTLEEAGCTSEQFDTFLDNHADAVYCVGLSILAVAIQEAENKRKWGWVGKAAAVGVGAVLGSFFG